MPVVVVPGVSSAHGVPAAAGIPLTHRGLGRSYAVITGRTDPTLGQPDIPYQTLADIDTIAILMGRSNWDEITKGLIVAGRLPGAPTACIAMGCTPGQRSVFATLETIAAEADREGLTGPVVTVVGEVVTLGIEQVTCPANVEAAKATADR
ncbi:MAG: hypothetical protein IID40_02835 [Planctomycetes bacterium]|nr:hypothetical protein [Planctomycetota bacterium]